MEKHRFLLAMPHIPVMLSVALRFHGPSCRILGAQSKHPEKVSVYMPHLGIFPMPPLANRLTAPLASHPYIPGFRATIATSESHAVAGHALGRIPWGDISSAGTVGVFRLRAHPHRGYRFSPGAPLNMTVRRWFGSPKNRSRKAKKLGHK
jgi:hypothetical protein